MGSFKDRNVVPKIVLRAYQDADKKQVEQLYRATETGLLKQSLESKLRAPGTWCIWTILYILVVLFTNHTILVTAFYVPFVCWIMYTLARRLEIENRVDEGLANDMNDPGKYYGSRFWVLTLDDQVCGMIGLSMNASNVEDRRDTLPIGWKQFCVAFLQLVHCPVPGYLYRGKPCTNDYNNEKRVFGHLQIPKTASITRWAVRPDIRGSGISTLLINRAITWASEHDINRVYALTNECYVDAEKILTKRHGFVLMKKYSLNFFGEYNKLFACRVKEWIQKND